MTMVPDSPKLLEQYLDRPEFFRLERLPIELTRWQKAENRLKRFARFFLERIYDWSIDEHQTWKAKPIPKATGDSVVWKRSVPKGWSAGSVKD